MNDDKRSDLWWVIAVIVAMFLIFAVGEAAMKGGDPPNNEPYTGVCLRPTPQQAC